MCGGRRKTCFVLDYFKLGLLFFMVGLLLHKAYLFDVRILVRIQIGLGSVFGFRNVKHVHIIARSTSMNIS